MADEVAVEDISADELEDQLGGEADEMDEEDGVQPAEGGDGDAVEDDDDEDDVVEDDDDFDDDDLDDDETDAAGADEAPVADGILRREDGAEWNGSAKRWVKDGQFAEGEAPTAEQLAAVAPAAAAAGAPAAGGAAPAWGEVAITVQRAPFKIPEAVMQRRKGPDGQEFVFLAMPEGEYNRFTQRIGMGVVAQRMSRDLDQRIRDLDSLQQQITEERQSSSRPKDAAWDASTASWRQITKEGNLGEVVKGFRPPSDTEIEAQMWLDTIRKKGVLAELLEQHEIDNLELRIKLAQNAARDGYTQFEKDRQSQASEVAQHEDIQKRGIVETVVETAESYPEFKNLSDDDLKEVIREITPFARALYWQENGQWFRNTEQVYGALRRKVAALASRTSAPRTAPATGGQPAPATATDRNERFNAGQGSAAKPTTTSVSARRGADQRPGKPPASRSERRGKKKGGRGTREQRVERDYRKTTRKWLASQDLDFPTT